MRQPYSYCWSGGHFAEPQDLPRLAGEYYQGDGLGFNWTLQLRKNHTFQFTWDGCLGRYDENHGSVIAKDGFLELRPRRPLDNGFGKQLPLRWVPLVWGERTYLLEENEIPRFAQHVNFGWEPRSEAHGMFLLRRDEWKKPALGWPLLPPAWSHFLLARPVEARVTKTLAGRRGEISAGTNELLQPGMLLTAIQGNDWIDVTVISVAFDRSVIEAEEGHTLEPDQRVTSKPTD